MKKILSILFLFVVSTNLVYGVYDTALDRTPSGRGEYSSVVIKHSYYDEIQQARDEYDQADYVTMGLWYDGTQDDTFNECGVYENYTLDVRCSTPQKVYYAGSLFVYNTEPLIYDFTKDSKFYVYGYGGEQDVVEGEYLLLYTITGGTGVFPGTGALVSSIGTYTGTTIGSLIPIIALIAGIALAIKFVPILITWIKRSVAHYKDYIDRVG